MRKFPAIRTTAITMTSRRAFASASAVLPGRGRIYPQHDVPIVIIIKSHQNS
ncbi:hypothetical protein VMCG_10634 [Cytospora schulzeri]|uniref:Uncharacterized protein n=1 Tax=Cytospora schulzeri TaxID=448051 RepID=A0A423VBE3_9PEZI|nr:hypothetical protein VMCG_10634 [Valsa malicola]